jgi:hypothetical protein
VQCPTPSSTVTITDTSSNSATYTFSNITGILDGSTSRDFDLSSSSLNLAEDFTVSVNYCFFNSTNDLTCQNTITFPVINTVGCPTVTLTSSYLFSIGEIQYSFVNLFPTSPTTSYRINVYDATLALVSTADTNAASLLPNPVTGAITGLTLGNYYFEIQIINTPVDGIPTVVRTCPKQLISIVSTGCVSPTSVEAYLIN